MYNEPNDAPSHSPVMKYVPCSTHMQIPLHIPFCRRAARDYLWLCKQCFVDIQEFSLNGRLHGAEFNVPLLHLLLLQGEQDSGIMRQQEEDKGCESGCIVVHAFAPLLGGRMHRVLPMSLQPASQPCRTQSYLVVTSRNKSRLLLTGHA